MTLFQSTLNYHKNLSGGFCNFFTETIVKYYQISSMKTLTNTYF